MCGLTGGVESWAISEIGLVLSIEALAFTLSSPLIGHASDRVGRRPIAFLGAIVTTASTLAYLVASSTHYILLASAFYGAGCSCYS